MSMKPLCNKLYKYIFKCNRFTIHYIITMATQNSQFWLAGRCGLTLGNWSTTSIMMCCFTLHCGICWLEELYRHCLFFITLRKTSESTASCINVYLIIKWPVLIVSNTISAQWLSLMLGLCSGSEHTCYNCSCRWSSLNAGWSGL